MPDTPKFAGFLSYAHEDDQHDGDRVSRLRERLERSIRVHSGLRDFTIFQDRSGIGWGADWDGVITRSLDSVVLLFPIITPLWFASPNCRDELHKFRIRQEKLGRADLILPIYYREAPLMAGDDAADPEEERAAAKLLRAVQFGDWRALRRPEETDPAYQAGIERLAERVAPVLRQLRGIGRGNGGQTARSVAVPARSTGDTSPATAMATGAADQAPPPVAVPTRIVDPWGRGDFTTISAALKDAPPGIRILVRPGHYNESLTIDRPVELVGDGEREDIVVEGVASTTLVFDTNMGIVRGISFRQRGEKNYRVWIRQGRLTIEGCDLTGRGPICLAISGGADPRVRRNRIHDGAQGGVVIFDDARGTYEENP